MGNYYSSGSPIEKSDELQIFNSSNTDIIVNDKSTQTPDDSNYNILLSKFNKLEGEKIYIQEELNLLKQKYDCIILKLDSEQFIKQIIKKIN
jgi:hypothetical protein